MTLTKQEVDQFQSQGYVVKQGVYTAHDMQPIQDSLTAIIHREALALQAQGELDDVFAGEPFATRLARIRFANPAACEVVYRAIMGRGGGGFHGPAMLGFLRHPPLLSCIERLVGPDIIGSSVYRIRPKLPRWDHGEVPWHQDSGYLLAHCDVYLIVTCWIPLVDATVANGCLHVLPGVHRRGILRHYTGGHAGYLEVPDEVLPEVTPVPVEMSAGDVLFMTNFTPHSSFENNSGEVRWSLDLRYQGTDAPTNIGEAPEDYTPEREPVTMACYPPEADFVIRDDRHPEREITSPDRFQELRRRYDATRAYSPGRGWTGLSERR